MSNAGIARLTPAEEPSLPPITVERPPDPELEARLSRIFQEMRGLESVRVHVREGVVHLGGTTDSLVLQRAKATAMRLEGVVEVTSDAAQPSSIEGALTSVGRALARLGRAAVKVAPKLVAAIVVFLPFALFSALLRRWRRPLHLFGMSSLTTSLLRLGVRAGAILIGLVLALDVLGIMGTVGAVIGAVGVIGIAASFVFRDWVSNYLPGVMLGLHPPFKAGDLLQIGAYEGRVARITPSSTVLVTTDGEEVRIPNAELFKSTMLNFSRHRARRLRFPLALAPQADLAATEALGRDALEGLRGVMKEPPPFMRVRGIGRDEVNVELFAWVDQESANFRNVESRAKRAVLDALTAHGVPLPETELMIRRAAPPQRAAEPARQRAESLAASAEDLDEAFLDQQLAQARAAPRERDLLEEGKTPSSESAPRSAGRSHPVPATR